MKATSILKGTLLSVIITAAAVMITAIIMYFTEADSRILSICMYAVMLLGVVCGAFGAAKGAGGKNILNGTASGILFLLILLLMSYAINGALALCNKLYFTVAAVVLASLLGGYLGREV